MNKLTIDSYAKLNLYLQVSQRRSDGYHNIRTVFERISLCDKIILTCRRDKIIRLSCSGRYALPQDKDNLAWKSAKLLQDSLGLDSGVDINIIKRIPVGAGLGGGSSNAASVLSGLNRLWGLHLTQDRLVRFAAQLGSDVPFFLYDSPFAYGGGRGDKIIPLKSLKRIRLWHVLLMPAIRVSTPLIYRQWDRLRLKRKLTRPKYNVKILTLALAKRDKSFINRYLFNGLEEVTCGLYPQVRRAKEEIRNSGLESVLMSGSGPAVFGLCAFKKEALSLSGRLRKKNRAWQVFTVCTR
ncbi:MAG: 4-(cytidine 5'-diphospho)-2-C-methyl-D-erythritol kinase [Candidatus Omnitrophota bacterium]